MKPKPKLLPLSKPSVEDALHQKLVTLAGAIAFVVSGLRSGSVKAQPILNMDPKAENYDMLSMEDYLTGKLKECGIELRSPTKKPAALRAAGRKGE
jgi:hypothetical protein